MKKIPLIILFLVATAFLDRLFVDKKNTKRQLIGGDKDEGGCLIGAGYSWCEKNKNA